MKKPTLTQEQKNAFEAEFHQIVIAASQEIIDIWNTEGKIVWIDDCNIKFRPEGIHRKLHKKQADDFVKLMNKYGILTEV